MCFSLYLGRVGGGSHWDLLSAYKCLKGTQASLKSNLSWDLNDEEELVK